MHHFIKYSSAPGAPRIQTSSTQDQVQRRGQANQPRKPLGPTAAWHEPKVDLRLAHTQARSVDPHSIVAGQRQLQTTAKRLSVDRRDHPARQPDKLVEDGLKTSADRRELRWIARSTDHLQISPGYELVSL